ncbi:MAG: hypothetical protein FWD69_10250 [Polyangiaceae bacterium]|nr:hypothetical protein [Polyangiaceae bacterium]
MKGEEYPSDAEMSKVEELLSGTDDRIGYIPSESPAYDELHAARHGLQSARKHARHARNMMFAARGRLGARYENA